MLGCCCRRSKVTSFVEEHAGTDSYYKQRDANSFRSLPTVVYNVVHNSTSVFTLRYGPKLLGTCMHGAVIPFFSPSERCVLGTTALLKVTFLCAGGT
jgi:hypothetical protein